MFYELVEKAMMLEKSGKRVVRLNVGDTNLPAPQCAIDALKERMGRLKYGYGSGAGMPELREAIAQREGCEAKNVIVGPGSKHLIFALLSVLAKPGASVFTPSPAWPAYGLICDQIGHRKAFAHTRLEDNWQFSGIPDGADVAIICNPLNPTSTAYPEGLVRDAIKKARESGIPLILDEAYKDLTFGGAADYGGAIKVRSFSKEFNMESWRLAYAVAPEEIAKKVLKFVQITATCVPEFTQAAGLACLGNRKEITADNRKAWKERADVAQKALAREGFRFAKPDAGIYLFATHEGIADSGKYALSLLDNGVAVSPGGSFGEYGKFVRICVNQSPEVLEEAARKMGEEAAGKI